jgi:hypothetical protein
MFGCVLLALLAAPNAVAKEFASLAIVGADGGSITIRPQPKMLDQLFDGPTTRNVSGAYVRVYPLGPTGHVGVPGRFYPATGALCLSWNQAAAPRHCHKPPMPLRRLISVGDLARFSRVGPTLAELESSRVAPAVVAQLRVAFELAFDRSRLSRSAPTPTRCLPFSGKWRGTEVGARSRRFCISRRGVYAGGLLYPLGIEPWRLAYLNPR